MRVINSRVKRTQWNWASEHPTILEKAQDGVESAVATLVESYQDTVFSLAMAFARNRHEAEDLAQDAWIRVLRGLPNYRKEAQFSTWVYRIVLNTFLNRRRRLERDIKLTTKLQLEQETWAHDREDPAVERIAKESVRDFVRELPEEFRVVVALRFAGDFAYKEIASILDVPLGTVQSRLRRGLDRLDKMIQQGGARA